MRRLRAPAVESASSEGGDKPGRLCPGPAAVLRGTQPHRATRCGGRRGVHEPVTARDEVGVPITANEVTPVPITAGDVVWRAPAERPRKTVPRAKREGEVASTLREAVSARAGGAGMEC